jgi:hypothetical protein
MGVGDMKEVYVRIFESDYVAGLEGKISDHQAESGSKPVHTSSAVYTIGCDVYYTCTVIFEKETSA